MTNRDANTVMFTGVEVHADPRLDAAPIRFYTTDLSDATLPAVIFMPGSGCEGAFAYQDGKARAPFQFMWPTTKHPARIISLEAPGVPRQFAPDDPGGTRDCPEGFMATQTLEGQQAYYRRVLDEIRRRGWLSSDKNILVGASDGAAISPSLALAAPEISHLLLLSGGGGTQLFSQLDLLTRDVSSSASDIHSQGQALIDSWSAIIASSDERNRTMYYGHPYSRWKTIGLYQAVNDMLRTRAKLYIVQGGQDTSSSPGEFAYTLGRLTQHQRPYAAEYIACGNHSLQCPDDIGRERLKAVIQRAENWLSEDSVDLDHVWNNPTLKK